MTVTSTPAAVRPASAPPGDEVRAAYARCAALTRAASTNFYYAFQTLPKAKRDAIYAAYAFCRECDDIVDEPERRPNAAHELDLARSRLAAAYEGRAEGEIWVALADAVRRFNVSEQHFADVAEGCRMDIEKTRYENFAELETYCRRVASAVGLIVIEVCGYSDERATGHAADLGIAMQLTNIMRDLAEDARNGRIYLPVDELRRFGYSDKELLAGVPNENFRSLMRFQAERARRYFDSGAKLFPYLDRRSRACPETIYRVYSMLLDRMEASAYDVFRRRVSLSKGEKVRLAMRLWLKSKLPFA